MRPNWKLAFFTIYAGQAFSILGSAAAQFAIIWWLTVRTESALTLTAATIVSFLPTICLGPFAGIWIDRYDRRLVMMAADGLVALSSGLLGAAFLLADPPPLWLIYGVLFLRGVGSTFHTPAMQAAIPMLVPVEMLTKAGGWGNLIVSVSSMLGPALGAGLMSVLPLSALMLVDVAGAAFAILCLTRVTLPGLPPAAQRPHWAADLRQGFAAIRANRPLLAVLGPILLCSLLYMPMGSLYPLLVRTHYHGEAWHNAVVEFVFSAGLFLSSLVMGLWGSAKRRFLLISASILALGLAGAVSGLLPAGAFWAFVPCCLAMGATGTFFNVPLMAYIQESFAPQVMGKVLSLLSTAMTLATPFGLLLAGPVSDRIGVDRWFAVSGAVMALAGLLCWLASRPYDTSSGGAPCPTQTRN